MQSSILFWLYLVDISLLILHEMDSAYWKEWNLFHLPGGIGGFLAIHFPLYMAGLYGIIPVYEGAAAGRIFAWVIGAAGVFAFGIHTIFLRRGHPEFDTQISKAILAALLVGSLALIVAGFFVVK
jgi:hypothetical protein